MFDLGFIWRKRWDSNPRAGNPTTAFRVRAVMTSSIHFHTVSVSKRSAVGLRPRLRTTWIHFLIIVNIKFFVSVSKWSAFAYCVGSAENHMLVHLHSIFLAILPCCQCISLLRSEGCRKATSERNGRLARVLWTKRWGSGYALARFAWLRTTTYTSVLLNYYTNLTPLCQFVYAKKFFYQCY